MMMMWALLVISFGLTAAKVAVEPEYLDQLLAEGRDEEFAKLMGIRPELVRSKEEGSKGSILYMVSPLGDILLPLDEDKEARQGSDFARYPDITWPNHGIPFVISSLDYTAKQRQVIRNAINDFNAKVSNVKLVRRRPFGQRDYVFVFSGNGCYSYLGRIGGPQPLSLQANGCVSRRTVLHEFIHAAGFIHENNRPDRDGYIKLLPKNIPPQYRSQYQKVSADDYVIEGPYDYYSVMHVPVEAPDSGGKPAFKVLQPGIDQSRIGRGQDLTQIDIDKLNNRYA